MAIPGLKSTHDISVVESTPTDMCLVECLRNIGVKSELKE
jgi:hypothetical protein